MYARHKRTRIAGNSTCYEFIEQISLFGCNEGFIPWLLSIKIPPDQGEPYLWHVNVRSELDAQPEYCSNSLIIDLKPKQNKTNVSLYELLDVWGYSEAAWTPILLRLNGLFVDEDPALIDPHDFERADDDLEGPIYEFLYLNGSVKNGHVDGLWITPPASPTNAALLWPETLNYFIRCIRETTPDVLQS